MNLSSIPRLKESNSQRIGRLGEICFNLHKPQNWIASSQAQSDYGFDYWVHVKENIDGFIRTGFLVQLKTTTQAVIKEDYVSITINAKNLNYYNQIACPLMLVYCDLQGYEHEPEKAVIYYCWYQNIELLPHKNKYLIKIPITNKLNRKIDLDNDVEKFVHDFQSFVTFQKYKNEYFPKKFRNEEVLSEYICKFSTSHMMLKAFMPTIMKIDRGSCLIVFALQGAEDCMMTFNHKTILYDLFCGSLNQISSLNRKFIVSEKWDDENLIFVQL